MSKRSNLRYQRLKKRFGWDKRVWNELRTRIKRNIEADIFRYGLSSEQAELYYNREYKKAMSRAKLKESKQITQRIATLRSKQSKRSQARYNDKTAQNESQSGLTNQHMDELRIVQQMTNWL